MKPQIKSKYDVIIIGAGIGGLVCGCFLARSGLKVLIIEKNEHAGGCCVSFMRRGVRFDAGAHIMGSCNKGGVFYNILRRLQIDQKFIQIDPTEKFFFSGEKLQVPTDLKKYVSQLSDLFPEERRNIYGFFDEMLKISRYAKNNYTKCGDMTYQDILDKNFKNMKLKSVLSAQMGYLGVAPKDISVIAMCSMLSSYLRDGAFYPIGGSGSLSLKLVERLKSYGGEILFKTRVTQIITKNNISTGVLAVNAGSVSFEIESDVTISGIDITKTCLELANTMALDKAVIDEINNSHETPSICILYLALKLDSAVIEKKTGWHYSSYDISNMLEDGLYVTSPSLYDGTCAKDGISVIEAFCITPASDYSNTNDWTMKKKEVENSMLSKIFNIIPESKNSVFFVDSATPKTIEKYTGNKNGSAYGWAMVPSQYRRNCLISDVLSNSGLYLAGHWTNPGGGVLAAAISGYDTAGKILNLYDKRTIEVN